MFTFPATPAIIFRLSVATDDTRSYGDRKTNINNVETIAWLSQKGAQHTFSEDDVLRLGHSSQLERVQPYFLHHVQLSSIRDIKYKIIAVYHSPKSIVLALFPLNSQSINFIITVTILWLHYMTI